MTDYTDGLNKGQAQAVLRTEGPVLILAGAGSGKTKMLTHRVAHILSSAQAQQHEILAVTFTNKAAKEMRERVYRLVHGDISGVNQLVALETPRSFMPFMGTFHGICVRMLRQDGDKIGLERNFVILDESDRTQLIKQISKELSIDEKQYPARTIGNIISSNKNELVSPQDFISYASTPIQEMAAQVYPRYQQELRKTHCLDFDDLLALTVEMLETMPEVRATWSKRFKFIMIDEYQDTNAVQYKLVKLLINDSKNICVVGDDWQSIYSWRGADFRNILNFESDYPDALVIKLEQNYRSTKHILDGAHSVITKNESRSDKKLWTDSGDGNKIKVLQVANERAEGEAIIRRIQTAVNLKLRTYNDYAILYRTNAQSRSLEEQFVRYGMPYRMYGNVRFYDRKEIKDIMAYLRLIYQPEDRVSFERVINTPTRGIGTKSIQNFFAWQSVNQYSLQQALDNVELIDSLTPRAKLALSGFSNLISTLRLRAPDVSVATMVQSLVSSLDYHDYVNDGTLQGQSRVENVKELVSVAENYGELGLAGFLEEVALVSSSDDKEGDPADSVTLMTLHSAKGLEFECVFLVGMEENVFPHSRSQYDQKELEEERRLCYVGMTRAKQELTLIYASSRMLYGSSMYNSPSRFITDIPSENIELEGMQDLASSSGVTFGENPWEVSIGKIPKPSAPKIQQTFEEGEVVIHKTFGKGTVTEVEGENLAIYFGPKGVKKINTAFVELEKVDFE